MKDFSVVKHGGHHECAYQPAENASINDDAFCRYLTVEFNESLVHIVHSILCGMLFPAESSPGEDDSPLFYVTQEILASDHKARRRAFRFTRFGEKARQAAIAKRGEDEHRNGASEKRHW